LGSIYEGLYTPLTIQYNGGWPGKTSIHVSRVWRSKYSRYLPAQRNASGPSAPLSSR
ncbi:hypothetical protein N657DRAFT_643289, partial [Parathielavia appendiculata]